MKRKHLAGAGVLVWFGGSLQGQKPWTSLAGGFICQLHQGAGGVGKCGVKQMNPLKIMLWIGLCTCSAWSASLTEESIRTVLKQRGEAFERDDVEMVVNLHTANAFISVTFPGVYDPGEDLDARKFARSFVDSDMKNIRYKSEPLKFEFGPATTSAVVKVESQMSYVFGGKRKRGMSYRIEETLTFVAADNGPRISRAELSVMEITLDPDELSERIMKQVRSKGGVDKETAIKLLEESGCKYREGVGKKKTTIHSSYNVMGCGDEIAALAASIPGVQRFELVWFSALSDEALAYLGKIRTLETLALTGLAVTDAGIEELAELDELSSLLLSVMEISDAALETIAALPSLEQLSINGAPKVSDIGLAHLAKSETLRELRLSINVTDKGMGQLSAIPNLTTLSLNRAAVSDAGLAHVATMTNLTSIQLYKTQVTPPGAKWLQAKRPELKIYPRTLKEPRTDSVDVLLSDGKTSTRIPTNKLKPLAKEDFDVNGAKLGRWTLDLAAAKKRAAEKRKPILLSFTESDRGIWCRIMEERVFTKDTWKTYAEEHLVMVLIDFPQNKNFVPEKYKARNKALKEQYEIPDDRTFVLLKLDGKTELGRLKAGLRKTPASFIKEVEALLNPEEEP